MKNIIKALVLASSILTMLTINVFSQNKPAAKPLVAYLQNKLWHFLDTEGKEMFQPKELLELGGYSEGFFRVKKIIDGKERWIFMNLKGEDKIIPDCDLARNFSEGMAVVMKYTSDAKDDVQYGIIDNKGKVILPIKYNDISDFSEGTAYVMSLDQKRGYIDKTGNYVLTLYDFFGNQFHEDYAAVSNSKFNFGYIDRQGNLKVDLKYDEAGQFCNGLAFVGQNAKYGFIDKAGQMVISAEFDYVHQFSEGMTFVGKMNSEYQTHWGLMDHSGNLKTYYIYDNVQDFNEGLAAVSYEKKWGFIDMASKFAIDQKFSYADSFKDSLAWASIKADKKFGYINHQGSYVVEVPEAETYFDLRWNRVVY